MDLISIVIFRDEECSLLEAMNNCAISETIEGVLFDQCPLICRYISSKKACKYDYSLDLRYGELRFILISSLDDPDIVIDVVDDKRSLDSRFYPVVQSLYTSRFNNSWTFSNEIGEIGTHAEVWTACCNKICRHVLKFMPFHTNSMDSIIKEVEIHRYCAEKQLAPEFKEAWITENGGVLIMDILHTTVGTLLLQYKSEGVRYNILKSVLEMIEKLHSLGIYHGDLHLDNIMVPLWEDSLAVIFRRISEDPTTMYRYYFIDFGESGYLDTDNSEEARHDNEMVLQSIRSLSYKDPTLEKYVGPLLRYIQTGIFSLRSEGSRCFPSGRSEGSRCFPSGRNDI